MARKPKKHAGGRPSQGLSEVRVEIPMPSVLRTAARKAADAEGVTLAEFVRRAVSSRLGV